MNDFLPIIISWNLTKRCNLKCDHCYLDASELEGGSNELTTSEALSIIDDISNLSPGAMLILTGGEPLLRDDFFQLAKHASDSGLSVVVGTNGTLLTEPTVKRLKDSGIQGAGISLDSLSTTTHDKFRGMQGAWDSTRNGIDNLKKYDIDFQVQFSVTKQNFQEVEDVVKFAYESGAKATNIFFLVCTGRGQEMTDIPPDQYEKTLSLLADLDKEYTGKMMVRGRCAPHFLRIVQQRDPDSSIMKGATSGCIAGSHYFRITPDGDLTPCPYMPTVAGNLRKESLSQIWNNSPIFESLRSPSYNGKCRDCEFNDVCGGCRARALAANDDMMGEDPWCDYIPDEAKKAPLKHNGEIIWEEKATERLKKVPVFMRGMVKKGLERYARTQGLATVTPEIMEKMRQRVKSKK